MMKYTKRQTEDNIVFSIIGDFSLTSLGSKSHFEEDYNKALDGATHNIIIDLTDTKFIDSRSIGILIVGARNILSQKKKFKLCIDKDNESMIHLLKIIRVGAYFDFYENVDDALKECNKLKL